MNLKYQFLLTLSFVGSFIFAGVNQIPVLGARQAALGNVSAIADDASIGYYNPAGLTAVKSNLSVSAGVFAELPKAKFTSINDEVTKNVTELRNISVPYYASIGYKPMSFVALGLNVNTAYMDKINWSSTNSRFPKTLTDVQIYSIQPALALKLNNWLNIGGGANFYTGEIKVNSNLYHSSMARFTELSQDDYKVSNWGWNAGVFLQPASGLNISLAYKSRATVMFNNAYFKATNTFNGIPNATYMVNTSLPMPAQYSLGVAYKAAPKLLVAGGFDLLDFSNYNSFSIRDVYDGRSLIYAKNWGNRVTYRIGFEYAATNKIDLRLGYYNDQSVMDSANATVSDVHHLTDRHNITGGLGIKAYDDLNINFYGAYVPASTAGVNSSVDSSLEGTVQTSAIRAGLGFVYSVN